MTRCIVDPRYVSGFPLSPSGGGLTLPPGVAVAEPLAHNVAKFSHASGAISQYNLTTILCPAVGGLTTIPPHSISLPALVEM